MRRDSITLRQDKYKVKKEEAQRHMAERRTKRNEDERLLFISIFQRRHLTDQTKQYLMTVWLQSKRHSAKDNVNSHGSN